MSMSSDTCYHSTTVNTFLHGTDRVRSVLYLCVTLDVRKIITFSVRVGLVLHIFSFLFEQMRCAL